MRKIKEVLRLKWGCDLSDRKVAKSCSVTHPTVADYVSRAETVGLSWPLPEDLDDAKLEQLLFPAAASITPGERPAPDWVKIHQELRRKGVTLSLLWEEYKETYPEGYQYSRFCDLHRVWSGKLDLVMRQEHRAGEKMFVDYAGQTVPVVDPSGGSTREAQIFVAVLGASNYSYAEATWTQSLPDWIKAHIHAFEFFDGVTEIIVPDNTRAGVSRACRYDPDLNPTYAELASYYGTAIMPARVRKPRDKAKVEVGVLVVERWILARLRNLTFFSLLELNTAIRKLLDRLNTRSFKKLPGSRKELFEILDRPALRPLPPSRYQYAEWLKARVNIDYHIEVDKHYYSVPYQLVSKQVDVRLTANTVECLHKNKRVASHKRSYQKGRYTTLKEHMPTAHREYLEWTPERLVRWAQKTGESAAALVETILSSRPHPQQGFRACLGIMRLSKDYGEERLEAACRRALVINARSYRSVKSILKNGLDKKPLPEPAAPSDPIEHANIRGAEYYH
jgi:transposase